MTVGACGVFKISSRHYNITMKYLGIDYGDKRIGIALSDYEGKIAFPRGIVKSSDLPRIVSKEEIERVVVGFPASLGGSETEQTRKVRRFAAKLQKEISVPIEFENEMLTTRMAAGEGVCPDHIDEAAAAIILQSYLDKQNR